MTVEYLLFSNEEKGCCGTSLASSLRQCKEVTQHRSTVKEIHDITLFTNQKERAYDYLVRARELSPDLPPDFLFFYGMSLQLNGDYNGAIEEFEAFTSTAKNKVYTLYKVFTKKYIRNL